MSSLHKLSHAKQSDKQWRTSLLDVEMLDTEEEVGSMPQVDCYVISIGSQVYLDDSRAGAHKSGTQNLIMAFCEWEWVDLHVGLAPGFRLILWNKNCILQKYSVSDWVLRF